jgi:hypothetical protein
MKIKLTGVEEVLSALKSIEDTLRNIGVSPAFVEAIFPAVAEEVELNFASRGARHADAVEPGARYPWGNYKTTWESTNPNIGLKSQGETYWLIETEDLIKSLTQLNDPNQRISQGGNQVIIESTVPYAGHVQEEFGAYLSAGAEMKRHVESELEEWLLKNLPGDWRRE